MNWGEFKRHVDEQITSERGDDFDKDDVEIDWIDVHMPSEPSVDLVNTNGTVSMRVTE